MFTLVSVHGLFGALIIHDMNDSSSLCTLRSVPGLFGALIINDSSSLFTLRSAPGLFGAFEGGFLLGCRPDDFPNVSPFYTWLRSKWDISPAAEKRLLASPDFREMYRRVLKTSGCARRAGASTLVDKTPGYVYVLDQVMQRAPGIPVIVSNKSRALIVESWARKVKSPYPHARARP